MEECRSKTSFVGFENNRKKSRYRIFVPMFKYYIEMRKDLTATGNVWRFG
jgi:hypothetical protein